MIRGMIKFTDATGGASQVELQLPGGRIGRNVVREPISIPGHYPPRSPESEWQALLAQVGMLRETDVGEMRGNAGDLSGAEAQAPSLADTSDEKPTCTFAFGLVGADLVRQRHANQTASDLPGCPAPVEQISEEPDGLPKNTLEFGVPDLHKTEKGETEKGLSHSESDLRLKSRRGCVDKQLFVTEASAQQTSTDPMPRDPLLAQHLSVPAEPARRASNEQHTDSTLTEDYDTRSSLPVVSDHPEQAFDLLVNQEHRQPIEERTAPAVLKFEEQCDAESHDKFSMQPSAVITAGWRDSRLAAGQMSVEEGGDPGGPDKLDGSHLLKIDSSWALSTRASFPAERLHARKSNALELGAGAERGAAETGSMLNLPPQSGSDASSDGARGPLQIKSEDAGEVFDQSTRTMERSLQEPEQRWTHAGTRFAEAGFQDPTLGWVSVRAERDSTGLHAVLVPASHDAGQMLSAHLSGLNAHLASQHIEVSSVTMSSELKNQMSSSFGNERQQQTSDNQGRQNDGPAQGRDSRGLVAATISHSTPWSGDLNRYEGTPLRYGAHGVQGAHVSLVA